MKGWLPLLLCALLFTASRNAEAQAGGVPRALAEVNVAALAGSSERLYVASFDDGLFVVERDGRARRHRDPALGPQLNALAWSEQTQTLWVGSARGLLRCPMSSSAGCERLGGISAVHALLLLDDGSLVAGGDAGLSFVSGREVRSFGKKQRAPFRSVWSLAEADGNLFVGTTNGLFWGERGAFTSAGVPLERAAVVIGNLPDDWVTALRADGDRLLVGTYNAGVVSFALGGRGLRAGAADRGFGYVNPAGLFALGDGRWAVASMDGLRAGELGKTVRLATGARDVTALAPALGGGYWVGTRRGLEWLARVP